MEKTMRIGEAAAYLHVSPSTLRNYCKEGRLTYYTTPAGHRVFTTTQLDAFLGKEAAPTTVFYCRDSGGNESLIQAQVDKLSQAYGRPTYIYQDKASGLNEKRRGLQQLLKHAREGRFTRVVITAKDRLTRFGYSYLEELLEQYGVRVEVLDSALQDKTPQEELLQDFKALLTTYSRTYHPKPTPTRTEDFLQVVRDSLHD